MAKYTTLYIDYVRGGGVIPSAFALIQNFETLFLERYGDRELGFETEDLFAIKLDLKANLVMGEYASKIAQYDELIQELSDPTDIKITEKYTDKTTLGEQRSTSTELPMDSDTATPNLVNNSDEVENEMEHDMERNQYEPRNASDLTLRLDYLMKRTNLVEKCLDQFESLFMGVY